MRRLKPQSPNVDETVRRAETDRMLEPEVGLGLCMPKMTDGTGSRRWAPTAVERTACGDAGKVGGL